MKKYVYTQQAVVRIWRNSTTFGNIPTSHFGHAAVTVAGDSVRTTTEPGLAPHTQNISFWPGGDGADFGNAHKMLPGVFGTSTKDDKGNEINQLTCVRLEVGYFQSISTSYPKEWDRLLAERNKTKLMARPDQKRALDQGDRVYYEEPLTLRDGTKVDVPVYYKKPEAQIYLPGLRAKGRMWGLNLGRMGNWWIDFKKTNPQYCALSKKNNCVGVALQGLIEGGAASIVKPPKFKIYAEPVQLEKYASDLEKRFLELESMAKVLDAGIRSDHLAQKVPYAFELNDGIWRQEVWKRESALGFLYTRSALITEIDRNVAAFNRLTWKDNFVDRFDALMNIFLGVFRHRQEKNDSKRAESVAQLGKQVLAILDQYGFYYGFKPVWR